MVDGCQEAAGLGGAGQHPVAGRLDGGLGRPDVVQVLPALPLLLGRQLLAKGGAHCTWAGPRINREKVWNGCEWLGTPSG